MKSIKKEMMNKNEQKKWWCHQFNHLLQNLNWLAVQWISIVTDNLIERRVQTHTHTHTRGCSIVRFLFFLSCVSVSLFIHLYIYQFLSLSLSLLFSQWMWTSVHRALFYLDSIVQIWLCVLSFALLPKLAWLNSGWWLFHIRKYTICGEKERRRTHEHVV